MPREGEPGFVIAERRAQTTIRIPSRGLLALAMVLLMGLAALAGPSGLVGSASAQEGISITDCGEELDQDDQTYTVSGTLESGNSEVPCIHVTGINVVVNGGDASIESEVSDDTGVLIEGRNASVNGLQVNDTEVGINVSQAQDATIDGVEIYDSGDVGIRFNEGTDRGNVVNSLVDNGESSEATGTGIEASGLVEEPVLIENTEVRNAEIGVDAEQQGLQTDGLTVTSNEFEGLFASANFQVHTDLTATDNGDGVVVRGVGGSVEEVTIQGDGTTISENDDFGLDVHSSTDVTISDGEFTSNGVEAIGVHEAQDVTIEDVRVQGGGGDGSEAPGDGVHVEDSAGVTIRNAEITDVPRYGVNADDGSDVSIEGSGTDISENEIGVYAETCPFPSDCSPVEVDVTDATVSANGGGDLVSEDAAIIDATNVNVGDSTASDTTFDAELQNTHLSGVDAADVPENPGDLESASRYLDVDLTSEDEFALDPYADLSLSYTDGDVDGLDESTLSLWNYDGEEWSEVDGTLDEGANAFSANLTNFSEFGLFAEEGESTPEPTDDDGEPAPSPLFNIEDVDAPGVVEPGDPVPLDVTVANDGDGDGTNNVTVHHDDDLLDFTNVFVRAGENHTLGFSTTFEEEGEYELVIDNETSVTVTVAVQDEPTPSPTPTATEEPTPTQTETPTPGGAPETPDDDDGGLGMPVLLVLLLLVIAAIAGGAWYYQQ